MLFSLISFRKNYQFHKHVYTKFLLKCTTYFFTESTLTIFALLRSVIFSAIFEMV